MRKETKKGNKGTKQRAARVNNLEKQKPLRTEEIAEFCVGLSGVIFHNINEGINWQKNRVANRLSPSLFRGLDELIWLIEIQKVFLEYLLATWDHEAEKKDFSKCLLMKDPVARDLVIQLHRRRLYLLNTTRVKEVE